MNTNNGVKWRRFTVPKKLNILMTTYSLKLTSQITYKIGVNDMTVNDSEMYVR